MSDKTKVYNLDCLPAMRETPDKFYDLAIVDPPYGLGEGQEAVNGRVSNGPGARKKWASRRAPKYGGGEWDDDKPNDDYFDEINRICKNVIIWGANHFGFMPPSSAWIVWFKKRFDEVNDFSDAELAYSSFKTGCRLFHFPWIGFGAVNANEKRIHPTQKPVALYKWLLKNYAKEGDKILDTHLGSQSSRIAAFDLGFDFTGYELDESYFIAGNKRFEQHRSQLNLFPVK